MAGGREYSRHQQKIISRYYEHLDTIAVARLGELVGELYLAESEATKKRLWARAEKALGKAGANEARVRKILEDRDLEGLAALVGELGA